MSRDICRGFTFLLSSCVKGQSLQTGLWDGWGSAQQLCWPTALPCCSTRRGRVVGTKVGPAWAGGGGSPGAALLSDPTCAFQWSGWGCCGAGGVGSTDCRSLSSLPAHLLTVYCSPF